MIAKLKGKISFFHGNYVVIDVNDVGYKVQVTAHTLGRIASSSEVELYTHTYVREDTLSLFGFLELEEFDMFELLISISGIGPKAALGILSIADPKMIRAAVLSEDPSILTRVSGVGKKIAQRVILELKNKVSDLTANQKEKASADSEAFEALASLGYSVSECREMLKEVPSHVSDVGDRVKFALKSSGKKNS
ncbi:MAG TPA: Holliday junction branch migration protein RuvA [Candidatus Moranbacteria bacterium]|nr:Holliday junction branch migration protein RuvA [Candidatus Moranbacteria bacterium]